MEAPKKCPLPTQAAIPSLLKPFSSSKMVKLFWKR